MLAPNTITPSFLTLELADLSFIAPGIDDSNSSAASSTSDLDSSSALDNFFASSRVSDTSSETDSTSSSKEATSACASDNFLPASDFDFSKSDKSSSAFSNFPSIKDSF